MRQINIGSNMPREELQRVIHDLEIAKALYYSHPHALRVEDYVVDEEQMKIYVFTIFAQGKIILHNNISIDDDNLGSMEDIYKKHGRSNVGNMFDMAVEVGLGIHYLHDQGILHRGVRMGNVMNFKLKPNFYFEKLTDISYTKDTLHGMIGFNQHPFPFYDAPEIIQNDEYSEKSDVWAFGCIMYELCTQKKPFNGKNIYKLCQDIIENEPDFPEANFKLEQIVFIKWLL
jgi:serine/threonine protein kinase